MAGKILIFGATGAVGSSLAKLLNDSSREIHLIGKNEEDLQSIMNLPFAGFGYDHLVDLSSIFETQNIGFIQGNFNEELILNDTEVFLRDLKDYMQKMKLIEGIFCVQT